MLIRSRTYEQLAIFCFRESLEREKLQEIVRSASSRAELRVRKLEKKCCVPPFCCLCRGIQGFLVVLGIAQLRARKCARVFSAFSVRGALF